ncbi:MAG: hypothetical protein F4X18_10295 [Acidimicrobiia bacterium]|nr:hypothetical protein [Acidimicrobiia bacterium]
MEKRRLMKFSCRKPCWITVSLLTLVCLISHGCSTEGSQALEEMQRPEVSYFDATVPPCAFVPGYQIDPCPSDIPSIVESPVVDSGWPRWVSSGVFPSYTEVLLGLNFPRLAIHVVVRGVVLPKSTRCELYPIELYDYEQSVWSFDGGYDYNCFVEVAVREYIVGRGPQTLTVNVLREPLSGYEIDDSDEDQVQVVVSLDDPDGRVSAAYEGKEVVLFLSSAATMSVESWRAIRSSTSFWFVQRRGEEVRVVSPDIGWADTAEERAALDMPLADLVTKIKAAAVERDRLTGGRVGITTVDGAVAVDGKRFPPAQGVKDGATLPMLVTDANKLQNYYVAAGAVYEGEDKTTVLPPKPPDDFVSPSTTVASSTTSSSVPASSSTSAGSTSTTVVGSSTTTTLDPSTTTSSTVEVTTTAAATTTTTAALTTTTSLALTTTSTAATTTSSSTTTTVAATGLMLSVSDASATEGERLEFVISLNEDPYDYVVVDYDVEAGTAEVGVDVHRFGGTALFQPFEVRKVIRVPTIRDSVKEGTETFSLVLSKASGATIEKKTGIGTILDDD